MPPHARVDPAKYGCFYQFNHVRGFFLELKKNQNQKKIDQNRHGTELL